MRNLLLAALVFSSAAAFGATYENVDLSVEDIHCSLNESTALITGWLGQTKVVFQKATMSAPICAQLLAQVAEKHSCFRLNLGVFDVTEDENHGTFWTSSHYKLIEIRKVTDMRDLSEICPRK